MEVKKKLLDIVRDTILLKHYGLSSKRIYIYCIGSRSVYFFTTKNIQKIFKKI